MDFISLIFFCNYFEPAWVFDKVRISFNDPDDYILIDPAL